MNGLELPRVMGISVSIGDPMDVDSLRGQAPAARLRARKLFRFR